MIKHTACPKEMFKSVLRARPFDSEEECLDAVLKHKVQKGDAVFIRYEGPKGSGMPEMFYTSEAISSDKELGKSIALITDGRFSGASTARLSDTAVRRLLMEDRSLLWKKETLSKSMLWKEN